MFLAIATICLAALPLAQTPPPAPVRSIVRDSTAPDSARRNAPRRLPVTAAVLATAFRDARARELFERARSARLHQDSTLASYEAKSWQRISVKAGFGKAGPDRLVFRQEAAARVRWQRGTGARIDVTGARTVIPMVGMPKVDRDATEHNISDAEMTPIPYFPGSETLWIGGNVAMAEADERQIVNPLATGAEAYYTYQVGDSMSFRFSSGQTIRLKELEVRPRTPRSNLAVGSLWFDVASGQLVRAIYRLAAPTNSAVSVSSADSTQREHKMALFFLRGLMSPNIGEVSSIVVEYGLYEGRFWLPRLQIIEGSMQAMFARLSVKYESSYSYPSVNAMLGLTEFHVDSASEHDRPELKAPPPGLDATARQRWRDSARTAYEHATKAREDSVRAGHRVGSMQQCDSASTRVLTRNRRESQIPVELRIPCNVDLLMHSPDLPPSIYGENEALAGAEERNRLIREATSLGKQASFGFGMLPTPRYQFGPSMTRYNRVEGLSTGLLVEQQFGGGYSALALGRYGFADRKPNGEFSIARSNLRTSIRLTGYTRLMSANDWGTPLNFSSGLSALLFGRDEGFYYRATGAELVWSRGRITRVELRAFTEQQRTAKQNTTWSMGGSFVPNVTAAPLHATGAGLRVQRTFGVNPSGWRAFTDLRLEGASSDSSYARGALDVTLTRALVGQLAVSLTVAGGSTVGKVPAQRRWFLGSNETVRGERADTAQSGNAFWLNRLELSQGPAAFRALLFGDIGWAGNRTAFAHPGRPLSGAGIGAAAFDGLLRFDIARGIFPRKQTRVNFYFNTRF